VTAAMTWNGGTLGGTGKLVLGAGAQMTISGSINGGGRPIDSSASGAAVNWNNSSGTSVLTGTFANSRTLAISGAGIKELNGAVMNLSGTTTWSGGEIDLWSAAVINNAAGALLDVQGNLNMLWITGGAPSLNNAGIVRRSSGTGAALLGPMLNNSGT